MAKQEYKPDYRAGWVSVGAYALGAVAAGLAAHFFMDTSFYQHIVLGNSSYHAIKLLGALMTMGSFSGPGVGFSNVVVAENAKLKIGMEHPLLRRTFFALSGVAGVAGAAIAF